MGLALTGPWVASNMTPHGLRLLTSRPRSARQPRNPEQARAQGGRAPLLVDLRHGPRRHPDEPDRALSVFPDGEVRRRLAERVPRAADTDELPRRGNFAREARDERAGYRLSPSR